MCQAHLLHKGREGRHTEVTNGRLQIGVLLQNLIQLGNLATVVVQVDREDHPLLFHPGEEVGHLLILQLHHHGIGLEAVAGDLNRLKTALLECFGLPHDILVEVLAHAAAEETIGIRSLHLLQIVVLVAVDILLRDDGRRDLRIVHVREEDLGRVTSVDHKGGHHLHLLAEEV